MPSGDIKTIDTVKFGKICLFISWNKLCVMRQSLDYVISSMKNWKRTINMYKETKIHIVISHWNSIFGFREYKCNGSMCIVSVCFFCFASNWYLETPVNTDICPKAEAYNVFVNYFPSYLFIIFWFFKNCFPLYHVNNIIHSTCTDDFAETLYYLKGLYFSKWITTC